MYTREAQRRALVIKDTEWDHFMESLPSLCSANNQVIYIVILQGTLSYKESDNVIKQPQIGTSHTE